MLWNSREIWYTSKKRSVVLAENRFEVRPAFLIQKTDSTLFIGEAKPELQYMAYNSYIPLPTFCDDIRAEIRFLYDGETLSKKAVFVNK